MGCAEGSGGHHTSRTWYDIKGSFGISSDDAYKLENINLMFGRTALYMFWDHLDDRLTSQRREVGFFRKQPSRVEYKEDSHREKDHGTVQPNCKVYRQYGTGWHRDGFH